MKENLLRSRLRADLPTTGIRIAGTWPFFTELVGVTRNFDYIEFVAEYAPFDQYDLENIARAAELHDMGTLIKVDFSNRAYIAQKAVASGFQAVLFTDHQSAEQVRESVRLLRSESPQGGGRFGYPSRRFIGMQPRLPQTLHAQRVDEVVLCFMIEKQQALDEIEEICAIPGVDMVQFGPSDFCMSKGWDRSEHQAEARAAERRMIQAALAHGVAPRCEIHTADEAREYMELGVRHFCLGDQIGILRSFCEDEGGKLREMTQRL